jgi:hypothetical protein
VLKVRRRQVTFLAIFSPKNRYRKGAVDYIAKFDKQSWYNDPIRTVLAGEVLSDGADTTVDTKDSFGNSVGSQVLSGPAVVDKVRLPSRTRCGVLDSVLANCGLSSLSSGRWQAARCTLTLGVTVHVCHNQS